MSLKLADIYEEVARMHRDGVAGVVATVVAVGGSTPRGAGAKMVVYPDGVWYSGVSPEDVAEIVRAGVDVEHIFHGRNERGVGLGRDHPIGAQVRLEVVFLSARATVLKCALGTILRSTTCSAKSRMVQRA